MTFPFAGSGVQQCGQRFLDSSDPRLIRHVASCEAAGENEHFSPAGKDEKLSREFEGGALIGRVASVSSSLDSLTNNRHNWDAPDYSRRPVGRGKYCGRWSMQSVHPHTNQHSYRRVNCGSWTCSYCGPRRAKRARRAIRDTAENLGLRYFLTLTVNPSKIRNRRHAVRYTRIVFNRFREYLRRKYGESPQYICVLEFTQKGFPHLHVLIDRYIPQPWISHTWEHLGGGRIVFIKQVTIQHVARYLSKYLTKELLLSAPKGTRRITTARSIKLFPKYISEIKWEFVRESIWRQLEKHRIALQEQEPNLFTSLTIHLDEDRYLTAFECASG